MNGKRTTQLFDLRSDPHELTNLPEKPEHATRITEMKASLQRQMKEAGDPTDLDARVWAGLKDL